MKRLVSCLAAFLVMVILAGCGKQKPEDETRGGVEHPPKGDTIESAVPMQADVLVVPAPKEVRDLWTSWGGKYILFVHRDRPIRQFSDLDGRMLFCAFVEEQNIIADAGALCKTGRVKCQIGIGNIPDACAKYILEHPEATAMVPVTFADHYKLRKDPRLVEIVLGVAKEVEK